MFETIHELTLFSQSRTINQRTIKA